MNAPDNDISMRTQLMGRLVFVWHGRGLPQDDEWDEAVRLLASQPATTLRVLVLTEGGAPTPPQQLRLSKVIGGKTLPIAVVSDLIGVRFVASALALFAKRLRTFRVDELRDAYVYLGLTADEVRLADAFMREQCPG